jgi:hypothetical protein
VEQISSTDWGFGPSGVRIKKFGTEQGYSVFFFFARWVVCLVLFRDMGFGGIEVRCIVLGIW